MEAAVLQTFFPLLRLPRVRRNLSQLFQPLAESYVPVSPKNNYCNFFVVLEIRAPQTQEDEKCSCKQNTQLKEHINVTQKKKH